MSLAAAAYCIMGDMVSCEKYKNMYITNGGNAHNINEYLKSLGYEN